MIAIIIIGLVILFGLSALYLGCLIGQNYRNESEQDEKLKNYWKGDK